MLARLGKLLPAGLLLVVVPLWAVLTWNTQFFSGLNDYLALYTGAALAGTPHLYDVAAMRQVHASVGVAAPTELFMRLPFVAIIAKPFAYLSYRTGYWIFQAISLAALIVFLWCMTPRARHLPYLCGCSVPVCAALLNGQDVLILLAAAAVAVVLYERGWRFCAGLALAVCATKFHIYGLIGVGLMALRAWRVLAGGAAGLGVFGLITVAGARGDWIAQYRALLNEPDTHPHVLLMGNLKSLTSAAGGLLAWAEAPLTVAVVVVFFYLLRKDRNVVHMVGYALIGGILICQHSYSQDFVVLLLAYALLAPSLSDEQEQRFRWILLPFVYLALFAENALSVALPLSVMALLAWLAWIKGGFASLPGVLKRLPRPA